MTIMTVIAGTKDFPTQFDHQSDIYVRLCMLSFRTIITFYVF